MIKARIITNGVENMRIFWICLVAVVIVIALYVAIHRVLINHATIMLRNQAQQTTDGAVNAGLQKLLKWNRTLSSQLVADVWGKGVMAFEYHFNYRQLIDKGQAFTKAQLQKQLADYAQTQGLKAVKTGQPVFKVTDWWVYEGILHIDVAYLLNESTVEYVNDLRRLSRHSK